MCIFFIRSYPVYAVGEYTSGGQQYYTTTTGNYAGTTATSNGNGPYIVPVNETTLIGVSERGSPQDLSPVSDLSI